MIFITFGYLWLHVQPSYTRLLIIVSTKFNLVVRKLYSMKKYLLLIGIIVSIISCKNEPEKVEAPYQFKDFYYPIDELAEGKVYVYTPVTNDSLESYFWYFLEQGGYLTGTKYNSKFQIEQITTEDILRNGTALHQMRLCNYNEEEPNICQPIDVNIEAPAVFPFEMQDSSSVFLYDVNWRDGADYSIIRNRHFIGYETQNWKGKQYDCIRFGIREEISVGTQEDGFQTFRGFIEEVYAQKVGLIYSKRQIEGLPIQEYQLADTTNMKALEEMFLNH